MYYIKEVSRNVEGTRASTALIENLIVASSQPRRLRVAYSALATAKRAARTYNRVRNTCE
jgi:hypothetical protein